MTQALHVSILHNKKIRFFALVQFFDIFGHHRMGLRIGKRIDYEQSVNLKLNTRMYVIVDFMYFVISDYIFAELHTRKN